MSSTTESVIVRRELEIAASPQTVWDLLVDPERIVTWMGSEARLDPHPGGVYRVAVNAEHIASGEVLELDPPHRLVVSFGWEPTGGENLVPPGSSTIEFELAAEGMGTRLRFTHRDLPTPESVERHGRGWDHYLERLAVVAAGRSR